MVVGLGDGHGWHEAVLACGRFGVGDVEEFAHIWEVWVEFACIVSGRGSDDVARRLIGLHWRLWRHWRYWTMSRLRPKWWI